MSTSSLGRSLSHRFRPSKDFSKDESLSTRFQREADKLYERGEWALAVDKYNQGTRYAPENANLWTGMATCYIELKRYEEAVSAARRAIDLNSLNARAWGQIGQAYAKLEQWITSFEAYDHAISILKGPDHSDDRLRGEIQLNYSEAKKRAKLRRADGSKLLVDGVAGQQPWELAIAVVDEFKLKPARDTSITSAWVILEAHNEYKKGYSLVHELKNVTLASGGSGLSGNAQAIAYMTNGIVRDERCFYMESDQTFMRQLAAQAQFEILRSDAWDLSATETVVIKEAALRQQNKGWEDVRPALSATVRIWILNAHLSQGLGQYGQAVGLYRRAIAVLDWGRKEWQKFSRKERGAIFDTTFVRGVRVLYGNTLVRAYEQTMDDKSQPYSLREIIELADRIQADCRDRPVKTIAASGKPATPVFILSSQKYPEGKARMCRAYYFLQLGKKKIMDGQDRAEAYRDLRLSANEYQNAQGFFPPDDEYYSICIVNTLEALFMAKTPLRETSAIITDLRASWAAASRIWAYSSFATGGGKAKVERLFQFQDNALKAVADKAGALGDRIVPGRLGDRIL